MDARPRSSPASGPVSSSAVCPACGTPIDTLRAGQVAVLDGVFRYFCNATCKGAYVEIASKRPALDAVTAEPPIVASGVRSQAPPPASVEPAEAPFFPVGRETEPDEE